MNEKNIYVRMNNVLEKIGRVKKNLNVGVGRSQYKAVGEADVLAAVKPAEVEEGIYSYPAQRRIIDEQRLTTAGTDYNGNPKETITSYIRIETLYRFINVDKPEEYVEVTAYGDGVDSNDKAPGKAMTYADKYAIMKAYKIETGDDPDASSPTHGQYAELDKLGVRLEDVAKRYKTSVDKLTREQLEKEIEASKKTQLPTYADQSVIKSYIEGRFADPWKADATKVQRMAADLGYASFKYVLLKDEEKVCMAIKSYVESKEAP